MFDFHALVEGEEHNIHDFWRHSRPYLVGNGVGAWCRVFFHFSHILSKFFGGDGFGEPISLVFDAGLVCV